MEHKYQYIQHLYEQKTIAFLQNCFLWVVESFVFNSNTNTTAVLVAEQNVDLTNTDILYFSALI